MQSIPFSMERKNFIFFFHSYCPLSIDNVECFESRGLIFSSITHYMAAAKAAIAKKEELKEEILNEGKLERVKNLAASLRVPEWNTRFIPILKAGIKSKFSQNEDLWGSVSKTKGKYIVFATEEDRFLGAGIKAFSDDCFTPELWTGKNLLGKTIMEIRDGY